MNENVQRYTIPAQILHWVTAVAVITGVTLGVAMLNVPSGPTQNKLFDLHRSFGALILAAGAFGWVQWPAA